MRAVGYPISSHSTVPRGVQPKRVRRSARRRTMNGHRARQPHHAFFLARSLRFSATKPPTNPEDGSECAIYRLRPDRIMLALGFVRRAAGAWRPKDLLSVT